MGRKTPDYMIGINEKIGQSMKQRIKTAGIRESDAAAYIRVTPQTFSAWVNGRSDIPAAALVAVGKLCGVAPSKMLVGIIIKD